MTRKRICRLQASLSNQLIKLAGSIHEASHLSSQRERQFNSDLLAKPQISNNIRHLWAVRSRKRHTGTNHQYIDTAALANMHLSLLAL